MTDLPFHIRQAVAADVDSAIRIDHTVFSPTQTDDPPETIRARQMVYPFGFLVCVVGDHVVGYISSEKWREMRTPKMFEDPRTTHSPDGTILCITALAVSPEHQRDGKGSQLLTRLISVAAKDGCHKAVVETISAERFYGQHGFTAAGEIQDGTMTAQVLVRELAREL